MRLLYIAIDLRQSTGTIGKCSDNAMAKSFFASSYGAGGFDRELGRCCDARRQVHSRS